MEPDRQESRVIPREVDAKAFDPVTTESERMRRTVTIRRTKSGKFDKRSLPQPQEIIDKRRAALKKALASPEARLRKSEAAKLCADPEDKRKASNVRWAKPGAKQRHRQKMKEAYSNPDLVERIMKTSLSKREPSRLEKLFIRMIEKYQLSFEYVGNGKLILAKRYCPDFISKDGKVLVEVNGSGHGTIKQKEYDNERYKVLAHLGYHILILKASVLSRPVELLDRIRKYLKAVRNTQAPRVIEAKMRPQHYPVMILVERVKV